MKRYSYPYLIEKKEYQTEWCEWSSDSIPYITEKWGNRITIPTPVEVSVDGEFYWYEQSLLDRVVRDNPVIFLKYGYFDWQLDELKQSLKKIEENRILISFCRLPGEWPKNVKLIHTEPMAYQFSRALERAQLRQKYHRQIKELKHSFAIMAMGLDQGRHKLMMMLKKLGLLDRAIHSNPNLSKTAGIYIEDNLSLNDHLIDIEGKILGDQGYVKFDVEKNLQILPSLFEECHFYVSIDTNPFLDNRIVCITEKVMWGVTTTTPLLPIWATNKSEQMKNWGFRFNNVGYRRDNESEQGAVQRWCERIMFLDKITQDPEWAQSWENSQGEDSAHNADLARRLHNIIDADIQRQIEELPADFYRL
jgi:hypothetical protein